MTAEIFYILNDWLLVISHQLTRLILFGVFGGLCLALVGLALLMDKSLDSESNKRDDV